MSTILHVAHEDRMAAIVAEMALRPEPAAFDRTDRVLIQAVETLSLLNPGELVAFDRSAARVRGRQLFVLVARAALGRGLMQMAIVLERDHTTIASCLRSAEKRLDSDPDFALVCAVLTAKFREPVA